MRSCVSFAVLSVGALTGYLQDDDIVAVTGCLFSMSRDVNVLSIEINLVVIEICSREVEIPFFATEMFEFPLG